MEYEEYKIMYEAEGVHWWYRGLRRTMFSLLRLEKAPRSNLSILDAGCGTGGNLFALEKAGFEHAEGFDFSSIALLFCAKRGLRAVQLGSITEIPAADSTFDVVISCDVLNDAGNDNESQALSELYRVLKPGGRLFLNLPAFSFLRGEHDQATDVARRYTRHQIRSKLQRKGFHIQRATYWNMFLFPLVLAVRLVRRDAPYDDKKQVRSDIKVPPRYMNALLDFALRAEGTLLSRIDLPVGSSLAVVAFRPENS